MTQAGDKEFLPYGRTLEQEQLEYYLYPEAYLGSSGCYW
jgi:hypothetical protein